MEFRSEGNQVTNSTSSGRVKFAMPGPPKAPVLRIFERVPDNHIVHAVRGDHCAPSLKNGEVAVITDQEAVIPADGRWYLIEHANGFMITVEANAAPEKSSFRHCETVIGGLSHLTKWWRGKMSAPSARIGA